MRARRPRCCPAGAWLRSGNYGTDASLPLPLAETNNPNAGAGVCIDQNPQEGDEKVGGIFPGVRRGFVYVGAS